MSQSVFTKFRPQKGSCRIERGFALGVMRLVLVKLNESVLLPLVDDGSGIDACFFQSPRMVEIFIVQRIELANLSQCWRQVLFLCPKRRYQGRVRTRSFRNVGCARKKPLAAAANRPMRSASKLQEVVGQAVKNLGRVRLQQPNQNVEDRISNWAKVYAWPDGKKLVSSMPRLRKSPQGLPVSMTSRIKAFLNACSVAGASPVTPVEVALAIPNYSKGGLESSFPKIRTKSMAKTTPQVSWLLSGFMSNCVEVNVVPVIYCRD